MSNASATFGRFIAVLLLVLPGWLATAGFLKMKDSLFDWFAQQDPAQTQHGFDWLLFLIGLIMFIAGVGFIAGWTFYRDRKRNYVSPRFREKKRPRPPTGS